MIRARSHARRAYTLVELLAVIAIIGVLAAIVIVSVGRVRESARTSRCGANIRQLQSLSLLWSQDNQGWVPQAMWSHPNIRSLRANATNLRSVGYTDALGKCDSTEVVAPNYGINNNLVSGGANGQWGGNYVQYYERGRYKFSQIQSAKTIVFTESPRVSWSLGGAGAYMTAPATIGVHHNDRTWVAYADGHVELKSADDLAANAVWTVGIIN
jgi:prepilin-type N-terminal cleavage/methylation domain-containing protein/prepilin-type processing-associated H-X9-DG protein